MLKILNFFKSATGETKVLSMRERFEAAQSEMNAVLGELPEMPSVTIDASARKIDITAPEQFADEALALPAPDTTEEESAELAKSDDVADAESDAPASDDKGSSEDKPKAEAA
ncbi:hypothetical protein [Planktotalea sp.]|uniref:hypothetical protein n=1 Tax=Planktotalea sp. TaxID=2029877 RepID=UPI0032978D84